MLNYYYKEKSSSEFSNKGANFLPNFATQLQKQKMALKNAVNSAKTVEPNRIKENRKSGAENGLKYGKNSENVTIESERQKNEHRTKSLVTVNNRRGASFDDLKGKKKLAEPINDELMHKNFGKHENLFPMVLFILHFL